MVDSPFLDISLIIAQIKQKIKEVLSVGMTKKTDIF
jgi:hypothetical protein